MGKVSLKNSSKEASISKPAQTANLKSAVAVEVVIQKEYIEIPVEKQVFIEVPVKDKRTRLHSRLISKKMKGMAQGMDGLLLAQKNAKSDQQMQLVEVKDAIRKLMNFKAKQDVSLAEITAKLAEPSVPAVEIRHVEIQKVHKGLVTANIILMITCLILLCK